MLSPGHPESPERLKAVVQGLKGSGLWSSPKVKLVDPILASPQALELVHERGYVEHVRRLSTRGEPLDLDTPTHSNTFELALLAAGGALQASELVARGEVKRVFALLRPPGHHAGRTFGGGFCFFNNLALAVESLKARGFNRVLILDIDAHHGNGTQDVFYEDPQVLFISFHQDGRTLYPGTGFVHEVGSGSGKGYNVNVPLPPGSSDPEYAAAMEEVFIPLTEQFHPQLLAVSVGFDAHREDPLTGLELSSQAFGWLIKKVVEQAEKFCGGRMVLTLEGGYNLEVLPGAAVQVVKALLDEPMGAPPEGRRPRVLEEVKRELSRYWGL